MHINSGKRNSCYLEGKIFLSFLSFSDSLQNYFSLFAYAECSLRLAIYFTRTVSNSGVENRGYVLDLDVSKEEIPCFPFSGWFPCPCSLISIMRWDVKLRNIKTKSLEASVPWVLNAHIFSSGIWSRLFPTKRMFEAVWEPHKFCIESDFLNITKALWQYLSVVFPEKSS